MFQTFETADGSWILGYYIENDDIFGTMLKKENLMASQSRY